MKPWKFAHYMYSRQRAVQLYLDENPGIVPNVRDDDGFWVIWLE